MLQGFLFLFRNILLTDLKEKPETFSVDATKTVYSILDSSVSFEVSHYNKEIYV